jgi:hypothetical protein
MLLAVCMVVKLLIVLRADNFVPVTGAKGSQRVARERGRNGSKTSFNALKEQLG